MSQELKSQLDQIGQALEAFKESHNEQIKELKSKGTVDPLLAQKVDKANEDITKLTGQVEQMHATLKRAPLSEQVQEQKELNKKMARTVFTKTLTGKSLNGDEQKFYAEQFSPSYKNVSAPEVKGLSSDASPDGGMFVLPQVEAEIKQKVYESSPMRQLANVVSITTDSIELPFDDDEVGDEWAGESESASNTSTGTSPFKMVRIFTHTQRAQPVITLQLLEDANFDIEGYVAQKVAAKFARSEATAFISGTGVGRPRGILSYSAGSTFGTIEQVNSGVSGSVTADSLIDLQGALFEDFQPNASWLMKRSVATAIRKLKDGESRYLWSFDMNAGLTSGRPFLLLDKPIYYANDMEAAASSSLSVAYGDFKQAYTIVDRLGVSVLRDPYTAYPLVRMRTRRRVGGGLVQYQALKLLKLTT